MTELRGDAVASDEIDRFRFLPAEAPRDAVVAHHSVEEERFGGPEGGGGSFDAADGE